MRSRIKIEIVSGLYYDFINYLVENGIYISTIVSTDFGVTAICMAQDYSKIARTARKFQCRTKIIQRKGIYFFIKKIIPRKSIVVAVVCVLAYIFLFTKIIWSIEVESPDSKINSAVYNLLYSNDIYAGTIFSQEKNQNIIQKIFTDVENVGYVTLNFYKGVLTCKVDPMTEEMQYLDNITQGNITASQNGVIKDLRVYSGFSDIKTGQTVTKGQLLVSSTYIDREGKLIQVMPRAYIKAECIKKYTAQVEMNKKVWVRTGKNAEKTTLKILGKDIYVKNDDNNFDEYDMEKTFRYIQFLGFKLPVTLEKTTFYQKEQIDVQRDESVALYVAKDIVHTMIKSDISLEETESVNYTYSVSDNVLTLVGTVNGYYDITK